MRIGRNVRVAADIRSADFVGRVVKSGESVESRPTARRRTTTAVKKPVAVADAGTRAAAAAAVAGAGRGKRALTDS